MASSKYVRYRQETVKGLLYYSNNYCISFSSLKVPFSFFTKYAGLVTD